MPDQPHIVGKLSDVAAFYGVTEGSIKTNWRAKMEAATGYDVGRRGAWNLLEIGRWLVCDYYKKKETPEGDIGDSMSEAKLAKLVEDAKTARLKRKRLDGTMILHTRYVETLMTLSGLYAAALDEGELIAASSASKTRKMKIKGQFERIRGRLRKRLEKMR